MKKRSRQFLKFKRQLRMIPVKDIGRNRNNPREEPSRLEVGDIRQSLESMGEILVPLVVYSNPNRRRKSDPKFILLDGERRWKAASELSKTNPKFSKVPANIISSPLTKYDNLRTMFNIHLKRREWSTSAVAEALEETFRAKPSLRNSPIETIAYETALSPSAVREALLFLRMPQEDRERALRGELDEYYLIFLSRNMRSIQNAFPDLITKSNWESVAKVFIAKVNDGWVKEARSLNNLGKMSRACLDKKRPELFKKSFEDLPAKPSLTPEQAWNNIKPELLALSEAEFVENRHPDATDQNALFLTPLVRKISTPTTMALVWASVWGAARRRNRAPNDLPSNSNSIADAIESS